MSETIEVTCEILAPPEGWVYDGWRVPNVTDQVLGSFWKPWDREGYRCHCAVKAPADDLPEGWTRDGVWILAPIVAWGTWGAEIYNGCGSHAISVGRATLPNKGPYRCVGFAVQAEVGIRPYSILGDWRATHAVLGDDQ